MEPDAQLVQGCLRGEGPAWEELVRRHTRRVFNLCYRFTGNSTEAEDLSQEVFLRIYRTLASYRPAYGAFPTWLTSVTRNLLVDHYRRTRRDRLTDSIEDAMPKLENKQSAARTPDKLALASELSGQLQHGLSQLFKVSKRLEHEEIDAAFSQSGNLIAKRRARLLKRGFAERFDANSERSNRARDPDIEALRRFASHARPRQVDLAHAIGHAVAPQAKAVAAECIGLDDLGASLEIFVMNPANHVRLRDIQLVIAPIDENSLGVQQRPHRSVAQHGGALQSFFKILRHRYQNTGMRRNLAFAGEDSKPGGLFPRPSRRLCQRSFSLSGAPRQFCLCYNPCSCIQEIIPL